MDSMYSACRSLLVGQEQSILIFETAEQYSYEEKLDRLFI